MHIPQTTRNIQSDVYVYATRTERVGGLIKHLTSVIFERLDNSYSDNVAIMLCYLLPPNSLWLTTNASDWKISS